jgi:hypothetical protein
MKTSNIDKFFLKYMEWAVRQLELYTKVSRDNLIQTILLLSAPVQTIWFIAISYATVVFLPSFVVFLLAYHLNKLVSMEKDLYRRTTSAGIFPREIRQREPIRVRLLFADVLCAVVAGILSRDGLLVAFLSIPVPVLLVALTLVEYLICTHSLLPHERPRAK